MSDELKKELREFLKENLSIKTKFDGNDINVSLYLRSIDGDDDDDLITSDWVTINSPEYDG